MTDVLIIGAGPAGSSLAIRLAKQGREVLLMDKAEFPREKVCGEGLMPAGVAALRELDIDVPCVRFHGIEYHSGKKIVRGKFPMGSGAGVRRRHMDTALVERASHQVRFLGGRKVDKLIVEDGRVRGVVSQGESFRAHLTIAADGANSVVRHALGWDETVASRRYAVRQHFHIHGLMPEWVQVVLFANSEAYVTPLPSGEISIALLTGGGVKPQVRDAVSQVPRLRTLLADSEASSDAQGASPLAVRAKQRVAEGIALLGDAAGNCDPITGGGISQALLSARLLAKHIAREFPISLPRLIQFDQEREGMLRDYRRLTSMVLALARRPALHTVALSTLERVPGLFSHLLGVASGSRTFLGCRLEA